MTAEPGAQHTMDSVQKRITQNPSRTQMTAAITLTTTLIVRFFSNPSGIRYAYLHCAKLDHFKICNHYLEFSFKYICMLIYTHLSWIMSYNFPLQLLRCVNLGLNLKISQSKKWEITWISTWRHILSYRSATVDHILEHNILHISQCSTDTFQEKI